MAGRKEGEGVGEMETAEVHREALGLAGMVPGVWTAERVGEDVGEGVGSAVGAGRRREVRGRPEGKYWARAAVIGMVQVWEDWARGEVA